MRALPGHAATPAAVLSAPASNGAAANGGVAERRLAPAVGTHKWALQVRGR